MCIAVLLAAPVAIPQARRAGSTAERQAIYFDTL
jgi:hypothetical protein